MKKFVLLPLVVAVAVAAVSFLAPSRGLAAAARETYIIIKIGDEYKAITTATLKDEQKQLADDYKEKMKQWQDARKTDPKAERPAKLVVKIIPGRFQTQKGAEDRIEKLKEQDEAAKAGKDKPKGKAVD